MITRRFLWSMVRPCAAVLLAAALLLSAGCGESPGEGRKLTIVASGFLKGNLLPYTRLYSRNRTRTLGGIAHVAGRFRQIEQATQAAGGGVLLVDLGNHLAGSVEAYVSRGQMVVEMLGRLPYAASLLSNMEFTFGQEILKARTNQARFPYIASNLTFADAVINARVKRELIVEAAGVKIAILGFSPANLKQICAPETVAQVTVDQDITAITRRASELKRRGVDFVLLLSKIPTDTPPEDVKRALTGSAVDLVLGIDYAEDGGAMTTWGNTLVAGLPADSRGSRLKVIELAFDAARKVVSREASVEVIGPESCLPDPEMEKILNEFQAKIMGGFKEKVGTLASPLAKGWKEESTMGDFITDAMRAVTGAELAVINSGAIQDDLPPGEITLRDLMQALPFDNQIASIEITGAKLKEALAYGLKQNNTYQVSGMAYRAQDDAEGNSSLVEVTVAGRPIDPARTYRLAITDFALSRLEVVGQVRPVLKGSVREVVLKALKARSQVDVKTEGRVTFDRTRGRR